MKYLLLLLILFPFFGCNEEASLNGPGGSDTVTVVHRDTVFSKDTIFVIKKDTILINKNDTVIQIRRDTLIVNNRDTVIQVFKDTVIVSRRDTIYVKDTTKVVTWSGVVEGIKDVSYAIGFRDNSNSSFILVGSGSAVSDGFIATNAHVSIALLKEYILLRQSGYDLTPVAIKNGGWSLGADVFALDIMTIHNQYDTKNHFSSDVSILKVTKTLPRVIKLASIDSVKKLLVGDEIATLGYPGDLSARITKQIYATFKSGIISSLTPFNSSDESTPDNRFVIQHDFNTTGGTSGSPIFNKSGELIGVHNSGNYDFVWDDLVGDFKRIPVGSIGWGIRVDKLSELLSNTNAFNDTISTWPIPSRMLFTPGVGISDIGKTKTIILGQTLAATATSSNAFFGTSQPTITYADGSFSYNDGYSFELYFVKLPAEDRIWSALISKPDHEMYLPSISDMWNIKVGASRSFILDTYGTTYTTSFSTDNSIIYYNYSALGAGFGFVIAGNDWQCDYIQVAQKNTLAKVSSMGKVETVFPNFGKSEILKTNFPPGKKLPPGIPKTNFIFR